uniref:Insulin degrading enzyme n=1 Tax=Nannochloropsis gaditana (strain CCMP526) TaxID=1093141 RepID=I2CRM3_NANGC
MLLFVNSCDQLLDNLSRDDFKAFVAGLVGKKLEAEKRLEQEAGRHWEEISLGEYQYDRPQAEAALLRTLSPTDVASFYHTFLRPGGSARRLLTSQIFPQMGQRKGGTEGGKEVEDKVEEVVEDELALRATLPKY